MYTIYSKMIQTYSRERENRREVLADIFGSKFRGLLSDELPSSI
jgi:hypothetical protein